ncbi:hypothetical protein [Jongsikchunia kroppenstedtii]|uniref:PIN-like domain-containing protein n=1 Tax=Jongsikchunia kroppenstedtii TaxID=1121721 RepID=UPI003F878CC8
MVDENLARFGRAMTLLRKDTACFGRDPVADILPLGISDSDWIPIVGNRGWVAITSDRRIRTRPAEALLAVEHQLRVIHLHGIGNTLPWDQMVRFASRWNSIENALADTSGPTWLAIQSNKMRTLNFEPGKPER